jgi:hypothetical protein
VYSAVSLVDIIQKKKAMYVKVSFLNFVNTSKNELILRARESIYQAGYIHCGVLNVMKISVIFLGFKF